MGEGGRRRRRVELTDEWEQIELLCAWPEQRNNEEMRPLVLFGTAALACPSRGSSRSDSSGSPVGSRP